MLRHIVIAAALIAPVAACHAESPTAPAQQAQAALTPLSIETATGKRAFKVEIARTEAQQEQGLMFRTSLPADGGMIFPFDPPRPATFWMKNTVIALDMIFIRADGTIARIAAQTTPYSLDMVESGEPVAAVLEIAGGRADELGIAEGDKVRW